MANDTGKDEDGATTVGANKTFDIEEIPEGIKKVAEEANNPTLKVSLWNGLKTILITPEAVKLFNETINNSLKKSHQNNIFGEKAAIEAMAIAGDVVLGTDRPVKPTPAEEVVRSAGPLMREVKH